MFGLEVDLLLGFDVEVEVLVRLPLVYGLRVPETHVPVGSCADYLLLIVAHELDLSLMARFIRANGYH